jgi:PAS domain S-box-containing protein
MFDPSKLCLRRVGETSWMRGLALMAVVWSALVAAALAWEMYRQQQSILDSATATARANIYKDIAFRKWAASHGGVYVSPNEQTPPNPYLQVPGRDVTTTTGKTLTLMNPAYVLRQMQSYISDEYGTRSHITSLKPINPNNAPDAWEARALRAFEQGSKELVEVQQIDGQPYLRIMLPFVVEPGCLTCHAQQGYKLGDIRGGISSSVSLEPLLARERELRAKSILVFVAIGLIWLAGLAWLGVSFRRIQRLEIIASSAAAIEESERRLRAVTESASDAIISADSAGNIAGCNAAAERMFGYAEAEMTGRPLTLLIPERYGELHRAALAKVAAGGEPHVIGKPLEFGGLRKDGSEFPLELSLAQWQAAEGLFFTAIIRDVTERKQADAALRAREASYSALVDNMNDGVAVYEAVDDGQDFVVREFNRASERIEKLPRDQVIGRRVTEVFPGVAVMGMLEVMRRVYRSGNPERLSEHQYQDKRIAHWADNYVYRLPTGEIVAVYADITSRKAAEEQILKLSLAVEQSPESIVITGLEADIEYANEAFLRITGYGREEVIGQNPRILQTGKTPRANYDALWDALTHGRTWQGEFYNRRKDGSEYIEFATIAPIRQSDGRISHYVAVKQDITERKRLEAELREEEARYRRITEGLTDYQYTVRIENGRAVETTQSPACVTVTGYTVEEFAANPYLWFQMVAPEDRERVMKHVGQILAGEDVPPIEHRIAHKNGELRWISDTNILSRDASGKLLSYDGVIKDISERKAAEEKLQGLLRDANRSRVAMLSMLEDQKRAEEAVRKLNTELESKVVSRTDELKQANIAISKKEEEIRAVVDHMLDCVITIDEKGIIRSANPAVDKIFGYSHEEVIGKNVSMLMPDPPSFSHDSYLERYLHSDQPRIVGIERGVEGLHKNGERIALDLGVSEYFFQGQRYFTGILRDVRERVRIMADLEQARKNAEQANRAKSEFLAAMSHEIRTPMNGVIGMVDVLQQSSLNEPQMEMVNIIHDSAFSLLAIIDDILDFSKIEAGKLQIDSLPMSIAEVVEGACEALDRMALKKEVELTLFTDPAIPAAVMGDPGRLRQILVNLANNAIKFSSRLPWQGKVSVRALLVEDNGHSMAVRGLAEVLAPSGCEPVEPHSPSTSSGRTVEGGSGKVTLEFRVTDNGIGIDEATQGRLFTAFTQADSSTTRTYGGTGLGLAISHQLVNIMGGEIGVQSEPGKGSLFSVRLHFALGDGRDNEAGWAKAGGRAQHDGVLGTLRFAQPTLLQGGGDIVAELSCLVVGDSESLGEDIAAYLEHDGAVVVRVAELAAAREWIAGHPPGLCVVVIDAANTLLAKSLLDDLRAAARARPEQVTHFVVIGRGQRRKPRLEDADLVFVDGNILARSALLKAVAIAAGRAEEPGRDVWPGDAKAAPAPLSREEARRRGCLILVAEDNEINQKVIMQQFELLGRTADIAANGREALEMWQSGDYAMLFADLHMPVMDGYELTAAIRAAESVGAIEESPSHIPIIAFTANALKGEAEHCRAIGMDDYLSKPVQLADLKAMLEKWLPVGAVSVGAASRPRSSVGNRGLEAAPTVDVNALRKLVGDDDAMIREFLHDFRISAARIAAELRTACAAGQAAAAGAQAHKLKSSARSVGALALGELCAAMEHAGKAGDMNALMELLPKFEQELAGVEHFLEGY